MVQAGDAELHASMATKEGQQGGDVAVQVKDRGTGLYELQFTLIQVPFQRPTCPFDAIAPQCRVAQQHLNLRGLSVLLVQPRLHYFDCLSLKFPRIIFSIAGWRIHSGDLDTGR